MTTLDYAAVSRYWSTATSSILGPCRMEGFGFSASAGRFRFRSECKIVDRLIHSIRPGGRVLNLGCGNGFWAEHFSGWCSAWIFNRHTAVRDGSHATAIAETVVLQRREKRTSIARGAAA